jgi:lysyl-tRNA synthetase class 2
MSPGSKNRNYIVENQRLAARESCLRMRAVIIQTVRAFFIGRGYMEIETPNLIPAPAPETHIDAISAANGFLHPSPELCMKRLLSAGYPAIFQVCKCYRGGERGRHHLPEFTLLEWYRTGADYMDIMVECEEMIRSVAADTGRGDRIEYMGREIDLKGPWQRMTVHEAFQRYSPMPLEDALNADRFDEIMALHIESGIDISRPLFLYDYPPSLAALSRIKRSDPPLAERFELYMGGLELANAFSELTDVDEQVKRFEKERERRRQLGKADYPFPDRFIKELGNMPDSAGIAFGIDRLVMLFADTDTIDGVVSFTPEEI